MARRGVDFHVWIETEEADALDSIVPFRKRSEYVRGLIRKDLEEKQAFRETEAKRLIDEREAYKKKYGLEAEDMVSELEQKREEELLEKVYREIDMEPTRIRLAMTNSELKDYLVMRTNQVIEEEHLKVDSQVAVEYIFKKVGENARG